MKTKVLKKFLKTKKDKKLIRLLLKNELFQEDSKRIFDKKITDFYFDIVDTTEVAGFELGVDFALYLLGENLIGQRKFKELDLLELKETL